MRIILGMADDKDLSTIMKMSSQDAQYYRTQPLCQRAFPAEKVVQLGRGNHLHGKALPTVKDAYQTAMYDADAQDFISIGGSSYVVVDLLILFK